MNKIKAVFYVILASVLWGTSGIFVHYLTPYGFTSYQMTAVRAIISFICMLTYVLICDRGLFRIKPKDIIVLLGTGISLFLTANLYFSSMQLTSVSTAVVLMFMAPIYVTVYSAAFFGERMTKSKVMATVCVIIGCALVSGIIGGLRFDAIGIILGALSGITYAAYTILTKLALRRGLAPATVTLYTFMVVSVISLFLLEPSKLAASIAISPEITLPMLVALGIVTFVSPYFLYTLGMRELDAGITASLGVVEPMSATLFSVILFQERLDIFSAIGIALILCAIILIGAGQRDKNKDMGDEQNETVDNTDSVSYDR